MSKKYICAFTALGCNYPEYMNFYLDEKTDEIEVTLRGPVTTEGREGACVSVKFPRVLLELMLEEAQKNLKP